MMALNSVEPKTSKLTGGVTLDLYGSGFEETQLDILPDNINSVDTSSSGGVVDFLSPTGVKLSLPEAINERASFRLVQTFDESFDFELFYTESARSFPLINDAKGLGFEVVDQLNTLNKVKLFIQYRQVVGYLLVVETWNGTTLVNREERPFDIRDIESFRIRACGKYIHGYVKTQGEYINFGKSSELTGTSYSLAVFTEAPQTGVGRESNIQIDRLLMHRMVSFIGYPTEETFWLDEHVRVVTIPGEISLGDIILVTAAGTNYKIVDEVRYVKGSGVSVVAKRFDTVQAITNEFVDPTREKLFSSNSGFRWDEGFLLSESNKNNNLFVPSLWDPTTGNIPREFFQSGAAPADALLYRGIKKIVANDEEKWFAQIEHGSYFIANVPYYLFSDESIVEYLGELKTEDGRSYHPLLYRPKIGIPIIASSLGEDTETKRIIERTRLQKRGKLTGIVLNGVELDTSNPDNIDSSKAEFIVNYNENNEVINWRIPAEGAAAGVYQFQLPEIPLKEFKIRFSRKDIFKQERTIARKYGEETYDSFQYGEGIEVDGDYAVDFKTGLVEVILDRDYTDLGYVSYTFDYPAVIEFNDDYTADKGTYITDPTFSDLRTLDDVGYSNGEPGQKFRLRDFPIVDYSSVAIVDTASFKLFVYDPFDNSFDKDWQRVLNFDNSGPTDKHFRVTSADGLIIFGDGVNGMIPPKYLKILAGYKPTLKIQFEPRSSGDYWSGKTVDLNLTKQNLNSGFLYLSRKNLIPAQIQLEFASPAIDAFETTELNATIFTQEGEVVPNTELFFEIIAGGGALRDDSLFSNPNGMASTIYTPSSRLEDIGIKVDLYEPGVDENTPGQSIPGSFGDENGIPYMSLKANELIQGDINEIYVFKILDDGDDFLPYNNETRTGGRLVLYHDAGAPVRGTFLAGSILGFGDQLPQSFDEFAPNYEPDLRGFYIVGKKTVQARAFTDLDDIRVFSDIVSVTVEYSPLQKGVWTLPTPPIDYESSQINTATYISI